MVPIWIRVWNILMEMMDRNLVLEVKSAAGRVLAID